MKNFLFLFFCFVSLVHASEKQTDQDILAHFARNADYAEIFRYCTYFITDPKPEVISHALQLTQNQDPLLFPLIKKAWEQNGGKMCEADKKSCEALKKESPNSEIRRKIEANSRLIEEFRAWIASK